MRTKLRTAGAKKWHFWNSNYLSNMTFSLRIRPHWLMGPSTLMKSTEPARFFLEWLLFTVLMELPALSSLSEWWASGSLPWSSEHGWMYPWIRTANSCWNEACFPPSRSNSVIILDRKDRVEDCLNLLESSPLWVSTVVGGEGHTKSLEQDVTAGEVKVVKMRVCSRPAREEWNCCREEIGCLKETEQKFLHARGEEEKAISFKTCSHGFTAFKPWHVILHVAISCRPLAFDTLLGHTISGGDGSPFMTWLRGPEERAGHGEA